MSVASDIDIEFPRGILRPELHIGSISSISPNRVQFSLIDAVKPSGAHFLGGRYGKGEVGEFILIEGQLNLLLGRVVEIQLPEKDRHAVHAVSYVDDLNVGGIIQLLGSVAMDTLRVTAGVESYPRLGDRLYAAPHMFVAKLPQLMHDGSESDVGVYLDLGTVGPSKERIVSIRPENLFGRHCAILGATGGGKSWTTARVMEECLRFKSKMILLDATGEYRSFAKEGVRHVHLGEPVEVAHDSNICSLPVTSFVESDFISLFEPAGRVQGPKLRAAIRSLRLACLKPDLATNGLIKKINESKTAVIEAEAEPEIAKKLDDPSQSFDVNILQDQIEQECVYPDGFGQARGVKDPSKWGGESGDFSYCLSLISRISGIVNSSSFECVFRSKDTSLVKEIEEFVAGDDKLLRVCLSGVSHEWRAREIIANVIGRHLLNFARNGGFKDCPIVVIVDEAHNFLGGKIGIEDSASKLDSFEIIAKEGRKYGLNVCLTTQRPRDITDGVLSQMGALVVHRLTNDRDREVVERACGEIDRFASSFLPNLKPGEAALIGADFPIPLTIQVTPPTLKPTSDSPDYQKKWNV